MMASDQRGDARAPHCFHFPLVRSHSRLHKQIGTFSPLMSLEKTIRYLHSVRSFSFWLFHQARLAEKYDAEVVRWLIQKRDPTSRRGERTWVKCMASIFTNTKETHDPASLTSIPCGQQQLWHVLPCCTGLRLPQPHKRFLRPQT